MKTHLKFAPLPLTIALASAAFVAFAPAAKAQDAPPPPVVAAVPPAAVPVVKPVPPLKLDHVLAREMANQISKATGAVVVTDSTTSLVPITFSTVGGSLPNILKQVTATMPKGVAVRIVMLPAFSPKAAMPSGDDLTALYTSQENLVVPVMGAKSERAADTINVLGKLLPSDKAAPIIAALDLRPVYLITNPNGDNLVVKASQLQTEGMRLWQAMTPEQRTQSAEQQFDGLMNMDSASRQAMFSQYAQVGQTMAAKIQAMPPAQRDQFIKDVTSGMKLPTPPAGGGGGGKGGPQQ